MQGVCRCSLTEKILLCGQALLLRKCSHTPRLQSCPKDVLLLIISPSSKSCFLFSAGSSFSSSDAFAEGSSHLVSLFVNLLWVADHVTWCGLKLPCGQRHTSTLTILTEDHHLDLVPSSQYAVDIRNAFVADLANMQQSIDATDIHESTICLDVGNNTLNYVSHLEALEVLVHSCPLIAQHHPSSFLVNFKKLEWDLLAHQLVIQLHKGRAHMASWNKTSQVFHFNDDTTSVDQTNFAGQASVRSVQLLQALPGNFQLNTAEAEGNRTLVIVLTNDSEFTLRAQLESI
mmetsp:Transcript_3769/g.4233  ORF Transcript_3769/g.4233 Transcript_3769/m.4233 type:complete len:288 (-) Transcript_3769:556-1419(-)